MISLSVFTRLDSQAQSLVRSIADKKFSRTVTGKDVMTITSDSDYLNSVVDLLTLVEGVEKKAYLDTVAVPPVRTIGYGFNMDQWGVRLVDRQAHLYPIFAQIGVASNAYDKVYSGEVALSNDQAKALLRISLTGKDVAGNQVLRIEDTKAYSLLQQLRKSAGLLDRSFSFSELVALQSMVYNNAHLIGPHLRQLLLTGTVDSVVDEIVMRSNRMRDSSGALQPGVHGLAKRRLIEGAVFKGSPTLTLPDSEFWEIVGWAREFTAQGKSVHDGLPLSGGGVLHMVVQVKGGLPTIYDSPDMDKAIAAGDVLTELHPDVGVPVVLGTQKQDTIMLSSGEDVVSGDGNDHISGAGRYYYFAASGFGHDIIAGANENSRLVLGGHVVVGDAEPVTDATGVVVPDEYVLRQGGVSYRLSYDAIGKKLEVSVVGSTDDSVTLSAFRDGMFGIRLQNTLGKSVQTVGSAWLNFRNSASTVALSQDRMLKVWTEKRSWSGTDVMYQLFDASGKNMGSPLRLNPNSAAGVDHLHVSTAKLKGVNGGVAVVWQYSDLNSNRIEAYLSILNDDGSVRVPATLVDRVTDRSGKDLLPDVIALSDGDCVVGVGKHEISQHGSKHEYGLFTQRFSQDGQRVGGRQFVPIQSAGDYVFSLAADDIGGFAAAFEEVDNFTPLQQSLRIQKYSDGAVPVGQPFDGLHRAGAYDGAPALFYHAGRRQWVVAYEDRRQFSLRRAVVNADATRVLGDEEIPETVGQYWNVPTVVGFSDDSYALLARRFQRIRTVDGASVVDPAEIRSFAYTAHHHLAAEERISHSFDATLGDMRPFASVDAGDRLSLIWSDNGSVVDALVPYHRVFHRQLQLGTRTNDNLVVSGRYAHLYGLDGNDRLVSGHGVSVLEGGGGSDEYVITPAPGAVVRLVGFDPVCDVLDLGAFSALGSMDDISFDSSVPVLRRRGLGMDAVLLLPDGQKVILEGIAEEQLRRCAGCVVFSDPDISVFPSVEPLETGGASVPGGQFVPMVTGMNYVPSYATPSLIGNSSYGVGQSAGVGGGAPVVAVAAPLALLLTAVGGGLYYWWTHRGDGQDTEVDVEQRGAAGEMTDMADFVARCEQGESDEVLHESVL